MSDLSSKTRLPVGTEETKKSKPVVVWATAGGLILALQIYVWTRWVTGPYFVRVPAGPSDPPTYMKVMLTANAVAMAVLLPATIYWLLIRPWVRERRITLDGLLFISCALFFFQDPLLNYFNTWCTYNTWLWNRGSWSPYIPGALSPEAPGAQVAEPLAINATGYGMVVFLAIAGCWLMRRIKNRWPGISNVKLILITYAAAIVLDFGMEAGFMLPFGLYTYPGAIRSVTIFADTYHQWPIYEGLMWGGVMTALACLRFFTDDRGRTIVERGLDQVRGGFARQQFVRFLAIFAAVSASFFFCYNLPAQWIALHSDPWPADHMKRSYFNGGICGDGTDAPCPNPVLPMPTKHSGYIDTDGKLIMPEGARLPKTVPFEPGN